MSCAVFTCISWFSDYPHMLNVQSYRFAPANSMGKQGVLSQLNYDYRIFIRKEWRERAESTTLNLKWGLQGQ